jgi:hypothetical protein
MLVKGWLRRLDSCRAAKPHATPPGHINADISATASASNAAYQF